MSESRSLPVFDRNRRRSLVERGGTAKEAIFSFRPIGGRFPRLALILFFLNLSIFAVSLFFFHFPKPSIEEYGTYVAVASSIILPGMFLLYFFAYSFYKDNFYLFVALGWLANFVYIFLDTYPHQTWSDFDYSLRVILVSVLTTLPFFFAGFLYPGLRVTYRRLFIETLSWVVWLTVTFSIAMIYIYGNLKNQPREIKLAIIVIPIVPYYMVVLWRVGMRLRDRLKKPPSGLAITIVPLTFYLYSLLQPTYLLKLNEKFQYYILGAFTFALGLKVINSVGLLLVINRDYIHREESYKETQDRYEATKSSFAEAKAKLEERSALEDLGLMTASIEHDIRNPLQVIGSEVKRLKEKLQAQPQLITKLDEIDQQKQRIFDATTMVPLLRGSPEFFDGLMSKVTMNDIVNAAIKDVKREMNPQNMFFRVNDAYKEKPLKTFFVKGYGPLLTQATVNILKNSIEAIREARRNSGLIDIEIRESSDPGEMVEITFLDNGRGISPEHLPQVKNVFTTRNDRKPNSGLGLFITNLIVRVHHGKLEITSTLGVDTTVSILLPKWRDEQHDT
jgi:signal transduction histidine kinase